jgi:hypothetical protein
VAAALDESLGEQLPATGEMDECQVRVGGAQQVAIAPLERRAGDDEAFIGALGVGDASGNRPEPPNLSASVSGMPAAMRATLSGGW